METCEKYYKEYSERMNNLYRPNTVDSNKILLDIFLKIQIEAYNQALEDAAEIATCYPATKFEPDGRAKIISFLVDKELILKLKK